MYQNSFLDSRLNTPVLLEHLAGPTAKEDEHIEAVRRGKYIAQPQKSYTAIFLLDAYDEIGIQGTFTDIDGQNDPEPRFIPWGAVLAIG